MREYGGHALALSLLGNVLRLRHQGDVRKRDTLMVLVKATGNRDSRHAFKVMQAYAEWLAGEPELALLHLLGLFDHPIGQDVLQMLWDAQIPHLTAGIDEDEWLEAIASLREEHHLLSQHDSGGDLDCHPLIREYFGKQLQTQQPQAWQQAHEWLYEYYKALPEKEFPDTLEEMQPLFSAVAHGCAAGLYQQALHNILWERIHRKEYYLTRKLGAFSDDLATIAHFLTIPWNAPVECLAKSDKAIVLNWAGFRLCVIGRLRESLEPLQMATEIAAKEEDWENAARGFGNLSELQLTLGDVAEASHNSQYCVELADQSGDMFIRSYSRAIHANTLHQAGKIDAALTLFREAEQFQREWQPEYPRLYSLQGFCYCSLLLEQGSTTEALDRAGYDIDCNGNHFANSGLLDLSLPKLTLGSTYFHQEDFKKATYWLNQAVAGLRTAGTMQYLPLGLLARAALYRHTHDFDRARQDLQEVFDIADGSGMRLYLTDYHLEMARLLLAEEETPPNPPCRGRNKILLPLLCKNAPPLTRGGWEGVL